MKNNLKEMREACDMTMQALADLAGTSRGHIHALEKPDSSPTLETAYNVADALNVEVAEIWKYERLYS
jgi:DNA-binding XRE family transcriptional regulator